MAFWTRHTIPYLNFHDLNDDWIIENLNKLYKEVDKVETLQSIIYADPLQWDITSQYRKNTIVVNGYNAYLSKQAVPQNISINNTDYWLLVGNFLREFEDLRKQLTDNVETTEYASASRTIGDVVFVNDILYEVIQDMNSGSQYIVDTNIQHTTIDEQIKKLATQLQNNIENIQLQLNQINDDIDNLDTQIDTDIENIQLELNQINDDISNLEQFRASTSKRYYVDRVNGNDDNDGRTQETAFKTLDRFFKLSKQYTDIRCYLVSPGIYPVTEFNSFSSMAVHITPLVSNCIVMFIVENALPFYNTYWHLEGLDLNNKLTFEAVNSNNEYVVIGGENNTFYARNCIFNSPLTFSCSFISLVTSAIKQVIFNTTLFVLNATPIINTDNTISPLTFANSKGRLTGSLQGTFELSSEGVSGSFIQCENSNILLGWNCPALTNKYYQFINMTLGSIIHTTETILNSKNRTVNGSVYDYNYGMIVTNNGVRHSGAIRYYNNVLQYFDAVNDTWVNAS